MPVPVRWHVTGETASKPVAYFFRFVQLADVVDTKTSVAKLVQVFVISNFEPNVTDWSDWNFDMTAAELHEAIVRIGVMRASKFDTEAGPT